MSIGQHATAIPKCQCSPSPPPQKGPRWDHRRGAGPTVAVALMVAARLNLSGARPLFFFFPFFVFGREPSWFLLMDGVREQLPGGLPASRLRGATRANELVISARLSSVRPRSYCDIGGPRTPHAAFTAQLGRMASRFLSRAPLVPAEALSSSPSPSLPFSTSVHTGTSDEETEKQESV